MTWPTAHQNQDIVSLLNMNRKKKICKDKTDCVCERKKDGTSYVRMHVCLSSITATSWHQFVTFNIIAKTVKYSLLKNTWKRGNRALISLAKMIPKLTKLLTKTQGSSKPNTLQIEKKFPNNSSLFHLG